MAIRRGQFVVRPLKKIQKANKHEAQRQAYNAQAVGDEDNCFVVVASRQGPLVSIVVPVFNPLPGDFSAMIYSVVNQHYENWELVLVNASSDEASGRQTTEAAGIDRRITVIDQKNEGISNNTNAGIKAAKGEYIAFLDHDDLLHPCALHMVLDTVERTGAELIYSDEDKITADSSLFFDPFYKPQWSPDLLRNVNYINHLTVVKAQYVRTVHGLRSEFDGAQDYDLLLRIVDICKPKIVHIPRVLYHWRAAPSSTASSISTKSYVLKAGTNALQGHLDRAKIKGTAKALSNRPGFYEIDFALPSAVSIVIAPVAPENYRRCATWLNTLLSSFSGYKHVQVVAGEWLGQLSGEHDNVTWTYIASNDYWRGATEAIKYEVAICFNVAAISHNPAAIDKLVGRAYQQQAIVAPVIVSDGGTILDAGLVKGPYGKQPLFAGYDLGEGSYFGTTEWVRNVDSLSLQIFAAPKAMIAQLTVKLPHGQALSHTQLDALMGGVSDIPVVMDAYAVYTFRGYFIPAPPNNNTYFNPRLGICNSTFAIAGSAWGSIAEESERDNA